MSNLISRRKSQRMLLQSHRLVPLFAIGMLLVFCCLGCSDDEPVNSRGAQVPVEELNQILREKYVQGEELNQQIRSIGGRIQISIDFSFTKLTDQQLAELDLPVNLTRLDLGGTSITDASIAYLQKAENLEELNLMGTQVTDACLEDLKKIPKLLRAEIHATDVSPEKQLEMVKFFSSRRALHSRQPSSE